MMAKSETHPNATEDCRFIVNVARPTPAQLVMAAREIMLFSRLRIPPSHFSGFFDSTECLGAMGIDGRLASMGMMAGQCGR